MAHLFVIQATGAPTAVIFRRGPSRWYHIIQWDTQTDAFTHGSWIKGRIYEDKCDLSPDGNLLIYFVFKGSHFHTSFTDAWTAISRVPFLQALTLWPQGTTYGGGGRFITNRTLALRGVLDSPHEEFPLHGLQVVDADTPLHPRGDIVPDSDWSGIDHGGRTVFSRGHCLYARLDGNDTLLADFSALQPDPRPAPEHAGELP
ncbi:hypothetical protein SH528x_003021 [Novipirellula sp. SH528]|uniref:hypothetical protein n=1 Tax=Novipirellula sp. SH528 TaxID=3454466 RepID=UPI003F9EF891